MSIWQRRLSLILIISCLVLTGTTLQKNNSVGAQNVTPFTPKIPFNIPAYNATIYFALDGTYNEAELQNDTWVFKGLNFSNSVSLNSFKASAQNCNVTLYFSGIFRGYLKAQESGLLQYNVSGCGVQRFNFGLSPSFGVNRQYRDLMVRFSSEFFTNSSEVANEGEGWQLATDGTLTVTEATTGASIMYVDYSNIYDNSTLPLYLRHSVTIVAVALMLTLVAISLALRFRQRTKNLEAK